VHDTDGGQLDHDTVFDRAVGPMQFIPSTWQVVKVDADGDNKRDPQDIDDASLATAVYLCSGTDNLGTRKGQEAAVYRYNHSQSYVNLVLRIMEAYSSGDYTAVPSGTNGSTSYSPSYSTQIDRSYKVAKERKQKAAKAKAKAIANGTYNGGSGSSSSGGTSGGTAGGVTGGGTSGGGLTGGGTGTTGTSKDPVGDVVKGVTGAVGGLTGGSASTPTPTPPKTTAPAPVQQVLSYADAKAKCIAQGISVLDVAGLATCIANLRN
jgi:hypothetical protein